MLFVFAVHKRDSCTANTGEGGLIRRLLLTVPAVPMSHTVFYASLGPLRTAWLAGNLRRTSTSSKPSPPDWRHLTPIASTPGTSFRVAVGQMLKCQWWLCVPSGARVSCAHCVAVISKQHDMAGAELRTRDTCVLFVLRAVSLPSARALGPTVARATGAVGAHTHARTRILQVAASPRIHSFLLLSAFWSVPLCSQGLICTLRLFVPSFSLFILIFPFAIHIVKVRVSSSICSVSVHQQYWGRLNKWNRAECIAVPGPVYDLNSGCHVTAYRNFLASLSGSHPWGIEKGVYKAQATIPDACDCDFLWVSWCHVNFTLHFWIPESRELYTTCFSDIN